MRRFIMILIMIVLLIASSCGRNSIFEDIQAQHYIILQQHLTERYGEEHDLYVYGTSFRERYVIWGMEGDNPVTTFYLRSASRRYVYFRVSVTDEWVKDNFWQVIQRELQSYIQTLFEENNAENIRRIWGSTFQSFAYVRLHESDEWIGLDTSIAASPGLLPNVVISIESKFYWKKDTALLAKHIKEWERIGRLTGLNIVYYRIHAVSVCPEPKPCTSPSWWCSHSTDITSILLSPYQIQNYNIIEILKAHIADEI